MAIALQTRLDEKEYKSREITDSFREFKREVSKVQAILLHAENTMDVPRICLDQTPLTHMKWDLEKTRLSILLL